MFTMNKKLKIFLTNNTFHVFLGVIVGLGLGVGLSYANVSDEVVSWLALPGDLFLRALKCIVVLMIFCSMMLAVIDMVKAGKAVTIGWKTIGLYAFSTCIAALEGLVIVLIFQRWFSTEEEVLDDNSPLFQIFCDEAKNMIMTNVNGVVNCVAASTTDQTPNNMTTFLFEDLNGVFAKSENGGVKNDVSLSTTLQTGVFQNLVSGNIVMDLANGNFLSVITFSVFMGVALMGVGKKYHKGQLPPAIFNVVKECNHVFVLMIEWIIVLTPFAVASLIAGALAGQDDLTQVFSDVGLLVAAALTGYLFHLFVFYPCFLFCFTRKNPYAYMKNIIPAQCMAFACSSSAATLPINIQCAANSGEVPKTLANFVLSLGATIN
eukprot:Pgem_evm1s11449